MAEELPTAAPAKAPAKAATKPAAKATKKKAAPRPKKDGPSLVKLIVAAVAESKDRRGTSISAVKKILATKGVDVVKANKRINATVSKLVANGTLTQVKGTGASGSFKITKEPKAAAAAPVKKVVKKKAPVKAKKPVAKKTVAAKKPAAKKAAVKKSPKKAAPKKPAKKAVKKSPKKSVAVAKKSKPAKKPAAKKATPKKTAAKKTKK
ncbi:histone H1-like [Embiotoca jacksoni]|uniref:histone H1-like n=1 Tax=Embiotoca jacksoni TaxID=100190 RepID=UPI0037039247